MIDENELADLIQEAFDMFSQVQCDPAEARELQAKKIANAISQFVIGRTATVTGTSVSGGTVTGTATIIE